VREVVPPALAGERVDRVVAMVTELPRAEVAALIEAGGVRVGGHTVERGSRKLREGEIDAPIGRSARDPTQMAVPPAGREARTRYEVLARRAEPVPTTELACKLETGRTHQIRVHLAAIGHPVVGDARYGGARPAIAIDRPFLHAERLSFEHPRTGEVRTFTSPLPADLEAVRRGLA
jgi:23S rRNA pseudouridine1911/1915/1917 synthase